LGYFSPVIRKYLEQHHRHVRGLTLDVGCGDKPHRAVFPHVSRYIGLDRPSEPQLDSPRSRQRCASVDLHGDALQLPFRRDVFDTVAAFQLLEHLPDPQAFLLETCRVLKPGGSVVLTYPLINPVHEAPFDFFRYTPFGLRHLCAKAGLAVVESIPMGGGWLAVGYLIQLLLSNEEAALAPSAKWSKFWRRQLSFRIYRWMAHLDPKRFHADCTLNYLLVARKIACLSSQPRGSASRPTARPEK
jgi:SAM-dependent methyltransferase